MSGWSTLSTTILAARRVVPPERILLATPSAPFIKETGPEDLPPIDSGSLEERKKDRLAPAPEPILKIIPSSRYQSKIEFMLSSTDKIKQLCTAILFDN